VCYFSNLTVRKYLKKMIFNDTMKQFFRRDFSVADFLECTEVYPTHIYFFFLP